MSATLRKIPERKCVGCNEKKPKNELIRIVRVADTGEIQIDATGKKNGRGAYICPSAACLKKAKKRLPTYRKQENAVFFRRWLLKWRNLKNNAGRRKSAFRGNGRQDKKI